VDSIIRGQLMKLGNKLVITTRIVDVNTTEILSSSTVQLDNIDEALSRLPTLAAEVAKNLPEPPPPNYFVGKWRAVYESNHYGNLVCIMDIKENGTIIVERYDTGSVTIKPRRIANDEYTYTPLRTGSGTGTWFTQYTDKNRQTISVNLSLRNVPSAASNINTSATLYVSDTTRMEFPYSSEMVSTLDYQTWFASYALECFWSTGHRYNNSPGGYASFSRIR
jgi:hypothetical protein